MSAHCKDSLSHPDPGNLTAIDLYARAKPCTAPTMHITTINNQRAGGVYQVEICVRPTVNAVELNGDPAATEYKHGIAMIRSGKKHTHQFPISSKSGVSSQSDELVTSISLYGSSWKASNPGQSESATMKFTVDL